MYLSRVRLKPEIGSNSQLGALLLQRTYGPHQLLWDLFEQPKRNFLYREEIAKEQLGDHAGVKGEPVYYILSETKPKDETPLFLAETKPFAPDIQAGQQLAFRLRANPVVTRQGNRHDLVMDEQLTLFRHICEGVHLPATGKKKELIARITTPDHASAVTDWLCTYLSQTRFFSDATRRHKLRDLLDLAVQEAVSRRLAAWLTANSSRAGIFSLCQHTVEDEEEDLEITVPTFQWNGYRSHPLPEKKNAARFFSAELSGELIVHDPTRFLAMLSQGIGPAKGFGCGLMLIKKLD